MDEPTAHIEVPSSRTEFVDQTADIQFRVHNRVVATKPLDKFFSLIGTKGAINNYERLLAQKGEGDPRIGVVHVYVIVKPRLFGLRLAVRSEDDANLLGIDGSVEYQWKGDVEYPRQALEAFLIGEAIPRVTTSVWTVMSELANTVGADIPSTMPITPEILLRAAYHQIDDHPDALETGWSRRKTETDDSFDRKP